MIARLRDVIEHLDKAVELLKNHTHDGSRYCGICEVSEVLEKRSMELSNFLKRLENQKLKEWKQGEPA